MREAERSLAELVDELERLVDEARSVPLSSSLIVPGDECRALVAALRQRIPEELREASEVLAARDEVLARAREEADAMLAAARAKVEEMISRSSVRAAAEHRAEELVEEACARAARLERQTEDWIDRRLAGVEIVLQDLLEHTRRGRNRLAASAAHAEQGQGEEEVRP
jgi:ElaB/YqjD/DUF883 family membrane-anchored ribosome-binding protein